MPTEPQDLPPSYPLCNSKINVDVAELGDILAKPKLNYDVYKINIATKTLISVNQFKQMFYARGDGKFSVANVYPCNDWRWILYSVWGFRESPTIIYNFNRLGGRENSPSGIMSPYIYESNPGQTFLAQIDIMSNIEKDICENRKNWTMCSRAKIFDSLYNLSLAPEKSSSPCLKLKCGRTWGEVEDALFEEAECRDITLTTGDIVTFSINVRLDNCHECVKPTIIRIRYGVKIKDIATDFRNPNPGWIYSDELFLSKSPNYYASMTQLDENDQAIIEAFGGGMNLVLSIIQHPSGATAYTGSGIVATTTSPVPTTTATFEIVISAGLVTSLIVSDGGLGYVVGSIVTFNKSLFAGSTKDLILKLNERNLDNDGKIIDNVLDSTQIAAINVRNAIRNPLQKNVFDVLGASIIDTPLSAAELAATMAAEEAAAVATATAAFLANNVGENIATLNKYSVFNITFQFSEAVSDLTVGNIVSSEGQLSNLGTSDNITYTATFVPNDDIETDNFGIKIADAYMATLDAAGITVIGLPRTFNIKIDTKPPIIGDITPRIEHLNPTNAAALGFIYKTTGGDSPQKRFNVAPGTTAVIRVDFDSDTGIEEGDMVHFIFFAAYFPTPGAKTWTFVSSTLATATDGITKAVFNMSNLYNDSSASGVISNTYLYSKIRAFDSAGNFATKDGEIRFVKGG